LYFKTARDTNIAMREPEIDLEFVWYVNQTGYRWVEGLEGAWSGAAFKRSAGIRPWGEREENGRKPEQFLIGMVDLEDRAFRTVRKYRPLSDPALFLRFITVAPPSPASILNFAQRYGSLGSDIAATISVPWPTPNTPSGVPLVCSGESIGRWTNEISTMGRVFTLFTMLQRRDLDGLSRHIKWRSDDKCVCYESHPSDADVQPEPVDRISVTIAAEHATPDFSDIPPGDLLQPAVRYIQTLVNDRLRGRVSPRLLRNETGKLVTHTVPDGLIGALWLQLAQVIARDAIVGMCATCSNFFVAPLRGAHDKAFCSKTCKNKAFRERQLRAQELSAEGVPLAEIAEIVATDPATAHRWITVVLSDLLKFAASNSGRLYAIDSRHIEGPSVSFMGASKPLMRRAADDVRRYRHALRDLVRRGLLVAEPRDLGSAEISYTLTKKGREYADGAELQLN
jgi:hypothetical protein